MYLVLLRLSIAELLNIFTKRQEKISIPRTNPELDSMEMMVGDLAQGSVEVFNSRNLFPVVCILINIWYTIDVENKCYLFDVKEFLDYG